MSTQDRLGNAKNLLIDKDSSGLVNIDLNHARIHDGSSFDSMFRASMAAGATIYGYFETGAKEVHWKPSAVRPSADKLYLEFYEDQTKVTPTAFVYDPVTRLGGIPPKNSDRSSSNTSTVIVGTVASPTIIGLPFAAILLPGSTGVGQTKTGGEAGSENERILKLNTAYIYKIYNGSSATNIVDAQFHWYEAD